MSDETERTRSSDPHPDAADLDVRPPEGAPGEDATGGKKKLITRRRFLTFSAAGVGLLLGTGYLTRGIWRRYIAGFVNDAELPWTGSVDPGLWLEVRADNGIVLHSPKVEMGQGTFTGLAQMVADELEVDIGRIRVVHAHTASGNVDPTSTGGSTSINSLWQPLREISASLREMLRARAAEQLGVEATAVTIDDGVLTAGGRSLTYGQVAAAGGEWVVPDEPPALKERSSYRWVGRPVPRVDLHEKVFGAPLFGLDAEMPDMLYGAVVRPDRIGARFVSANGDAAAAMPGVVQVVIEDGFAGVVAETHTAAERAKEALEVEWAVDRSWALADIEAMTRVGEGTRYVIQKVGDAEGALSDGEVIEAEFTSPIGAHAQIEPGIALAHVTGDAAVVFVSTQVVAITRREVADLLGFDEEQVDVRPTYLGGGFGRRLHTPIAMDAARLSRATGRPVKVVNSRKEEFQRDTFRPPTHHVLRARLSADGLIDAIEHNVSSGDVMHGSPLIPSVVATLAGHDIGAWRGGMIQYGAIPNHQAVSWRVRLPFATSWWRSLGLLANTFAIESFMDELAEAAGRDPVEFRLAQIQDDEAGARLGAVIRTAAERAGWRTDVRDGVAMGFAASTDARTPCAQVAAVSIEEGRIRVHKVTCAIDPGLAVNPDLIRQQCEGAIVMGLSAAVFEEMTVQDGVLSPTLYGPYRMALMRDAPREIDVEILENSDRPGAVGEPPLGPIGAAIANAVWRLTGERLRSMPLQPALDRALA
ncbi:MAG TPA: molybdopterin cofactor-binding domain-containing protein [Longimicrobiales bacterium]|nr:molybdopterin cofactor-binding domain-containing protein [Longimicrobiales bacterium]